MLTGWESVPGAFVATAWQDRGTWGASLERVRRLTLGSLAAGVGPGRRVAVFDDVELLLAVLAAGAVAVLDGSGGDEVVVPAPSDLPAPDAFERAWQAVDPGAEAVVAGATFTHENLVAAVRSLALATGAAPGGTVRVDLPATVPAAHLLAPLTGAVLVRRGPADIVLRTPDARVVDGYPGVVSLGGRLLPGVVLDDGPTGVRLRADGVAPSRQVDGWLAVA